jgi:hypothetical protein
VTPDRIPDARTVKHCIGLDAITGGRRVVARDRAVASDNSSILVFRWLDHHSTAYCHGNTWTDYVAQTAPDDEPE